MDPVKIDAHESIKEMLKFFMGKNTPIRQEYIIRNLRFEHDLVEQDGDGTEEDKHSNSSSRASKKTGVTKAEVAESAAA